MNTVAAGLTHGVEVIHGGLGVAVHMDAAHEVVLGGNHGDGLLGDVVALFQAVGVDVLEVAPDLSLGDLLKGEAHVVAALLLHLGENGLGDHVTGQQLLHEALALAVDEDGALAPAGLGDQEGPAGLAGVQAGGMDLHVVQVLQLHTMALGDLQGVAGEAGEVGGVLIVAANAAGGHDGVLSVDGQLVAVLGDCQNTGADAVFLHDVGHGGVLQDLHVGQLLHGGSQLGGDLFAGQVVVEADPGLGVSAFAGVGQGAVGVPVKVHAVVDQLVDDGAAGADHDVHALLPVLVVTGLHGVLEEGVVVVLVPLHADAALGQHGVAALQILLAEHQDLLGLGQVQGGEQSTHTAACDDGIVSQFSLQCNRLLL